MVYLNFLFFFFFVLLTKQIEEEKENNTSFAKVLLTLTSTDEAVLDTYTNYVKKAAKIVDVNVSKRYSSNLSIFNNLSSF